MKSDLRTTVVLPMALVVLTGCSWLSKTPPPTTSDGILVGPSGMTLYTFDKDEINSGRSTCVGSCSVNWPPFTATVLDSASGEYSIIVRDDGRRQWAYRGKPVYFWFKDSKPGDKSGDGFGNAWRVAKL